MPSPTLKRSGAKVKKTYQEINQKILKGKAVVLTAEEMVRVVEEKGAAQAAREVDVVTTGTFGPMCSSGMFLNFGHSSPKIRAHRAWLNNVPAYTGIAAVDVYLGATELPEEDPLNKVFPGSFFYGGGHVIHELVAGKEVQLRATSYGTDCYPRKELVKKISLKTVPQAILFNPRNAYQNYNCAVNLSDRTIYTYMGILKPNAANASYCSAGQLSPLLNDPYFRTIGVGTRIFLGGGEGYVTFFGTQHNPNPNRNEKGVPTSGAGTISVTGDLKQMKPEWLVGASLQGYGATLYVGLGIPIPILDEEMAFFTAVKDQDIVTQIIEYSHDYPFGTGQSLGEVTYAELKSGKILFRGKEVPTAPLSSYPKAVEIAETLKEWIRGKRFFLGEPQWPIPPGGNIKRRTT
ncbi:MAG: homocysteine biosynthesis protein [bacterium]